jgi:hypothetical protein
MLSHLQLRILCHLLSLLCACKHNASRSSSRAKNSIAKAFVDCLHALEQPVWHASHGDALALHHQTILYATEAPLHRV